MTVDAEFFDNVFVGGSITEERIDAACVKIVRIAGENAKDAKKADHLLKDILLLGIANGLAVNPQRCAEHYFSAIKAAFGEPTLLDQVKKQFGADEAAE